jgi:two-component system response regulator YesN
MLDIKILVVDDEQIIRNGLEKAITQLSDGFQVLATADDGETALQWLKETDVLPDLLITDIFMRFVDGIELIEQVNALYPTITCVILSGHEDFKIAQKAIKLMVQQYIIKPIQLPELHAILNSLRNEIGKNAAGRTSQVHRDKYVREKLLMDLIEGRLISEGELNENAKCFPFPLVGEYIGGVIRLKKNEIELSQRDLLLYSVGTKHLFTEVILEETNGFVLIRDERTLVFGLQSVGLNTKETIEQFTFLTETALGIPVMMATGNVISNLVLIPQSVNQAFDVLDNSTDISKVYPLEEEHQFRVTLGRGRSKEALHYAQRFMHILASENTGDTYIVQSSYRFAGCVEQVLQELSIPCPPLPQLHQQSITTVLKRMEEWVEICVTSRGCSDKSAPNTDIVDKVLDYINKHYSDYTLSLQCLADIVSVHPNYLTQKFRRQTGFSCIQYLAKTRMEKAKQLLDQTDLKISDIAEKVGYENPLYFSSYFKKWVGLNPSEYRDGNDSYG